MPVNPDNNPLPSPAPPMRPIKIAILLHAEDHAFENTSYLLCMMMETWKARGHTLMPVRGADRFVEADVLIPHIDLTVMPDDYRALLDQYPIVVNRRIADISKSKISQNIVGKCDKYDGPVIVKTDGNYGGLYDARFNRKKRLPPSFPQRAVSKLAKVLGGSNSDTARWKHVESLDPGAYPVYSSLREVPGAIFKNKNLVVEKFLPERDSELYCLRYYYFFGDREVNILLKSREKVVKGSNSHFCEEVPVPPEIRTIRRTMGFDYGKFDYVIREGRVVLFDTNTTPSYSTLAAKQLAGKVAAHLADGIESLFESPVKQGG